jgi:hypothetical protein
MAYADLLINECDIQRFTEAGTYDAYGQPVKTWADIYTDEPCRHITGKGREIRVGQEVHTVYDQLFVGNIDITVQDRVIVDSETYQVVDVLFRQDGVGSHHKEAYLEIVR